MNLIEKLKKLESCATKGPWVYIENSWSDTTIYTENKEKIIARQSIDDEADEKNEQNLSDEQAANTKIIIAMRNSLPALLEALEIYEKALREMIRQDAELGWDSNLAKTCLTKVKEVLG